jgi:hypothetical protein
MDNRLRIVGSFAAVGFVIPWLLLGFHAIAYRMGIHPSATLFLYLCPPSIITIALDHASLILGLIAWLIVSAVNAVLYAIPGAVVSLFLGLRKSG